MLHKGLVNHNAVYFGKLMPECDAAAAASTAEIIKSGKGKKTKMFFFSLRESREPKNIGGAQPLSFGTAIKTMLKKKT